MENIISLIIVAACISFTSGGISCDRTYTKLGCFKRTPSILPDLLVNDRDPTHANFSGITIDWKDYGNYLHSLACRCAERAKGHYNFIAIGFYGECFAGRDEKRLEKLLKTGLLSSSDCIDGEYTLCDPFSTMECSGKANAEYIYKLEKPIPKCVFKDGDGVGGKEVFIGTRKSNKECIEACLDYQLEDKNVNGVTTRPYEHGSCYCEISMTGRNNNKNWISCMFE